VPALPRLFISHSSVDNVAAIAFKQWLGANGWPSQDVFLDVEDIGAGERWKDALRKAHARCEAVILLASPEALSSAECLTEVRKAEDYGKEIIVVLLRDLTINDRRLDSYKERQIVDLSAAPQTHIEDVEHRGKQQQVHFNGEALAKVKDYLLRRGITPESFPWPPEGKADADPFPGLNAFGEDEAAIFFGRDFEILSGLDAIRLLRRKGSPRFFAIQASSGAGKSSFLRAGLWPRLSRDPDFAPLAILRPAQAILTGPDGLGQKLASLLSGPAAPRNPGDIYTRLMAADAAKAAADFADLMKEAAAQAHDQRRIGDPGAPPPALILAIDQAEELFAAEDAAESERLLFLLGALLREPSPGVDLFVLLTVRVDSATRLCEAIVEQKLDMPDTFTLLRLQRTSYRDVVTKPIEVVARRGQKISISAALADRLVEDATGADALPLLAFTLFRLYRGFSSGGSITLEHYQVIGGVAGSIRDAIKDALAKPGNAPIIPAGNEQQLACLHGTFIPWLARIDPGTGEAMRRVARLDNFNGATHAMVERLVESRVLVRDRRDGVDIVEVAHESVLRQWPPLTAWLQADADDLRAVEAIERAADEWKQNGKQPAWLDHRSDRLAAAERVAAHDDFRRRLGVERIAYLAACRARETRQRRIAQAIAWSVAAVFAVFSALLGHEWRNTLKAQSETDAALLIAQSELDLTNGNVPLAIGRAARAFKSIPSVASRSALLQALMEVSPHLTAAITLGDDAGRAMAWTSDARLDFATGSGHLRTFEVAHPSGAADTWDLPVITRAQDGNPSVVRALSPLWTDRMIVVFDEGTVGVYQLGAKAIRVQAPKQEITVNPMQHAVAVTQSGALIALATTDETIVLYRCDWNASAPSVPACEATFLGETTTLGKVHGRVVAINPDEKRIAVGDQAGKVTIYDLAGNTVAQPPILGAAINALGWTAQRDWLAAGTINGEIAVFDTSATQELTIAHQTFRESPIAALAWNPTELALAFVCNGTAVCLWRSNADANQNRPFKPATRFEGHTNTITQLSFAPAGTQLASAATDGSIRIWSAAQNTDATFALYADEADPVSRVAVSPDRKWVAGGSLGGLVELWDANTKDLRQTVRTSDGSEVRDMAWNHDGTIASLNEDTVTVIVADRNQTPIKLPIRMSAGYHLSWADEDRKIAVAMIGAGVIILDPKAPQAKPTSIGENNSAAEAWGVAGIPRSHALVISYVGGDIKIWDLASNSKDAAITLPVPQKKQRDKIGVGSLSITSSGGLLAASSGDNIVTIYDVAKRTIWTALETEAHSILTVAFSPDGKKLAALGDDKRMYVWTFDQNLVTRYLTIGIVPRRAIVDDGAGGNEKADWLDWLSDEKVAVATDIAAISVFVIDPDKWFKRIDSLAINGQAPIH
jgi:WD40 repeat protein